MATYHCFCFLLLLKKRQAFSASCANRNFTNNGNQKEVSLCSSFERKQLFGSLALVRLSQPLPQHHPHPPQGGAPVGLLCSQGLWAWSPH